MTSKEPPASVKDNPFAKLDAEGLKNTLAQFQEALKGDAGKDIDLAKTLGIETKAPDTPVPSKNEAAIRKWIPIFENAKEALTDAGYKFDITEPKTAKMSEAEKAVNERLETLAQAKFSELNSEILKIDKDFPVEIVSKLSTPTEHKVLILSAFKEVASRNQDAVLKVQKELDTAKKQIEDNAKFSTPGKEKEQTGSEKVDQYMAKMGMTVPSAPSVADKFKDLLQTVNTK